MTLTSIGTIKLGADVFVNLKSGSIDKHYKTDVLLGQGAYGKVWKVIHKTTGSKSYIIILGLVRAMK